MQFYSTKHQSARVNLETAVIQGLPTDNGLFMPEQIHSLPTGFFDEIHKLSFQEMAYELAACLLQNTIDKKALKNIVYDAVNFPAPLVKVSEQLYCLELFHGPSLAFKDFGARFMARLMSHFIQQKENRKKLYILVATSGDTGGAVAQGFLGTPGIEVIILYPSKKISELQEKQLTTLGQNITALEIKGAFDDCQSLVKAAFLDQEVREYINISSANSINIARLIPQAFYYASAYAQAKKLGHDKMVFCVPSGNFGNLTAGLLLHKMGMPVEKFIAANNANNAFTKYHQSGVFSPRASVKTYSNAMDVGNPSNLQRIQDIYGNQLNDLRNDIAAYSYTDEQTLQAMKEVYADHKYIMCPHTAVAYLGVKQYLSETKSNALGIYLGTAHPAKFLDVVEPALNLKVDIPKSLQKLANREKVATLMDTDYTNFKQYLMALPQQ